MFGEISDKTKRDAYLNALSQERDNFVDLNFEENNNKNSKKEKFEEREIVSGKEAIKLANKDIDVVGTFNKKAINSESNVADMRYYSNWRTRLADLKENTNEDTDEDEANIDEDSLGVKPSYSGDEIGREPGLFGDDTTLSSSNQSYKSSKDLLDGLYQSNTKEEDDSSISLLDSLFKNRNINQDDDAIDLEDNDKNERQSFLNRRFASSYKESNNEKSFSDHDDEQNEDDYTLDNFEDDFNSSYDDISANSVKVHSNRNADEELDDAEESYNSFENEKDIQPKILPKKDIVKPSSKPRKKKKKYDADIIGVSGFFG
ncbi:MAG: hypothetical protein IJT25_03550 [Clostridia bacterium]|nr:hypothetical protein [Clostridia bacterium]